MDYLKLFEDGYRKTCDLMETPPINRLDYLGDYIFNFTTYDDEKSIMLARWCIEVCEAINNGNTFDYIKSKANYMVYVILVNMPFFQNKLTWGSSIRGAWWESEIKFTTCGLWDGDNQLYETMTFSREEWVKFIAAMIEFAGGDATSKAPPSQTCNETPGPRTT